MNGVVIAIIAGILFLLWLISARIEGILVFGDEETKKEKQDREKNIEWNRKYKTH